MIMTMWTTTTTLSISGHTSSPRSRASWTVSMGPATPSSGQQPPMAAATSSKHDLRGYWAAEISRDGVNRQHLPALCPAQGRGSSLPSSGCPWAIHSWLMASVVLSLIAYLSSKLQCQFPGSCGECNTPFAIKNII